VILSDFSFVSLRPAASIVDRRPGALGAHRREGIFVAAGPAIAPRTEGLDVSYYDVVPTIVDVLRFSKPAAIDGVSRATDGE
jgi:hypothetical protein